MDEWMLEVKENVPLFLSRLKGNAPGFYHYSFTGDYFSENAKWGLGNSVFALKIYYTLNDDKKFKKDIDQAIGFIKSFENDGEFSDPLVRRISLPLRFLSAIKNLDPGKVSYKKTSRAETRQAISALELFEEKPSGRYKDIPKSKKEVIDFLSGLDWERPWDAGANFSHLLFFLRRSKKDLLVKKALEFLKKLTQPDGAWYTGNPSLRQKVNGAMKIITGMNAADCLEIPNPKALIDLALEASNDEHACDQFNVIYVLKYAWEATGRRYRSKEVKKFAQDRLELYKEYWWSEYGGFSFQKGHANRIYYGAPISKGRAEPDIHGTVMFMWGLSIIEQILYKKTLFREFLT